VVLKQTIPVVDLDDFMSTNPARRRVFVDDLGKAFVEYGFVAIENHGIEPPILRGAYGSMKTLFEMDSHKKSKYELRKMGRQRGYTPFGKERAKDATAADLKEFWHVGPEFGHDNPLRRRIPDNIWPIEVPTFKSDSLALWGALHGSGLNILRALALYLGEPEETFSQMVQGGNTVLRMIRYPEPTPSTDGIWAAAHEDINLITLLVEASDPGLELKKRNGDWLPIMPVPGQLIADTGDMMQRLTNGLIPATTHRVRAPQTATGPRYSIPFFMHPHPDVYLDPLPSCREGQAGLVYPRQTAEAYLGDRLRANGVLTVDVDVDWMVGRTIDEDAD